MPNYWETKIEMQTKYIPPMENPEIAFDFFVEGMIQGIETTAIHKDGKLLCGALQREFKDMRQEILVAARVVKRRLF